MSEVPSNGPERVAYADALHAMALEQWEYIFPPWRWPKWFRRQREIKRRMRLLRAANAQTRRELGISAAQP